MQSTRSVISVVALVLMQLPAAAQLPVVPAAFHGYWGSDQTRCMTVHEGRLTVFADELLFYESRAKVLSARQVGRNEVEFELESTGEGQTWREVRRFSISPDAGTLTDVTTRFTRVRCEQLPLPFVDEAPNNPDFLAFRANLLDAVTSRDSAFILSIVSDRIRNSFGGNGGIDEFESYWQLDSEDSRFWAEFETVLRLGGALRGEGTFVAPYTTATWPSSLDGFEHAAIVGSNVNVRAEPSLNAPVLSRMSYQTVRLTRDRPPGEWQSVHLADGDIGYVNRAYLRSPNARRAYFERTEGQWVMTSFIAGD
jgi:hypothetical protein